jgi:hypothetical protein
MVVMKLELLEGVFVDTELVAEVGKVHTGRYNDTIEFKVTYNNGFELMIEVKCEDIVYDHYHNYYRDSDAKEKQLEMKRNFLLQQIRMDIKEQIIYDNKEKSTTEEETR